MSIKTLKIDLELCKRDLIRLEADLEYKQLQIDHFEKSDYLSEEQYDDMIDDVSGVIEVCGMSFNASRILQELDPTAYNCGFSDYVDSLDLEDFEEYNDLLSELSDLEDEVAEQESDIEEREAAIEELEEDLADEE